MPRISLHLARRLFGLSALLGLFLFCMPGTVFLAAQARPVSAKPAFVLGLGWQPAYCEKKAKRPECSGSAVAPQFSLQGLWVPGQRFCHVEETARARDKARDWLGLPAVALPADLDARLKAAMPGTVSGLDRHVWLMNGSCQTRTAEAYFALQLRLLDEVNGSAVGRLFKARLGQGVDRAAVVAAFTESFGEDSALRVKMRCRKIGDRMLVTGLTLGLGATPDQAGLKEAMAGAPVTRFGCESGIVDQPGSSTAKTE